MLTVDPVTHMADYRQNDPVVGGALSALDGNAILSAEGSAELFAQDGAPAECRLIEALYHPNRYVRAAFALLDGADIPAQRYWPQGRVIYLQHPIRRPLSRRGTEIHLNGVPFECYVFPNDRRLRGLRRFTSRQAAVACWQAWLDRGGDAFDIDAQSLRRVLLRYVPEQKWIARLRCRGIERSSRQTTKRSIAVRCANSETVMDLAHRHALLACNARRGTLSFDVPDVVGVDPIDGLVAFQWLKHQSLVDAVRESGASEISRRVAEGVASLHKVRIGGLPRLGLDSIMDRISQAANHLQMVNDTWVEPLERMRRSCDSAARRAHWDGAFAMLHNDLHLGQIGYRQDRMVLFDLERLTLGNPAVDAAGLYIQIRMAGRRPEFGINESDADAWAKTQLDAFRNAGLAIDWNVYRLCAVMSALELAQGMMRHLRNGWLATAQNCIRLADDLINERCAP